MLTLTRRRFLAGCAAGTLLSHRAGRGADPPETRMQTYTYKRVGDLEIKADVHRPDDSVARPVLVWIHGGALINGHRASVPGRVRSIAERSGCALVSIDYRLAPETRLPEIIRDVEDAFAWIGRDGPRLFGADARRVGVMGGSAGGYLTLVTGYRARPRPRMLVAFWGYGDLIGDWYSTPSPHPRHHRVKLSRDEAYQQVSGPPVSDARQRRGNGGAFYQYCRQQGHWPKAVSGWDPHEEAEKFHPLMPVKNVSPAYPPTMLIHGTDDTDVPHEQSVMMARQLKQHGVEHRLISMAGEHGLQGADADQVRAAYEAAEAFTKRFLQA